MIRVEYTAAAPDDGKALRAVLRGSMGLSASLVKAVKWLPDGILIDGVPARLDAVVRFGQRISVSASAGAPARLHAGPVPPMPPVLYEDGCLLIIDKPAGMTVHPSAGHSDGTLADAAADYLRRQDPFAVFCPVSRLDRYTSGVLCAAKNRFAAQRLSAQLQNGGMSRVYRAVLCGALPSEEGVVDAPIAHGSGVRREVSPGGRPAVTHWRVLRRGPSHTLAELWLETGRTPSDPGSHGAPGLPGGGGLSVRRRRRIAPRLRPACAVSDTGPSFDGGAGVRVRARPRLV